MPANRHPLPGTFKRAFAGLLTHGFRTRGLCSGLFQNVARRDPPRKSDGDNGKKTRRNVNFDLLGGDDDYVSGDVSLLMKGPPDRA